MKLIIKNVGKISDAQIELNGITVIAGENNTGKSTLSKSLYAVFNSFSNVEKQIQSVRMEVLDIFGFGYFDKDLKLKSLYDEFESNIENGLFDEQLFVNLMASLDRFLEKKTIKDKALRDILRSRLSVSSKSIHKKIITEKFRAEFSGQISQTRTRSSSVELKVKDQIFSVSFLDDQVRTFTEDTVSLKTTAVYIDDPFVLNSSLGVRRKWRTDLGQDHREYLKKNLYSREKSYSIDEIHTEERLSVILDMLSHVCKGKLTLSADFNPLSYSEFGSDEFIQMSNVSAGLKTFLILQTLLINGTIRDKGTIILDEPEIHLHPKWQLVFAELIVLLQKEFGLHVLLTTHSPYFLRAIEIYSHKHKIEDGCKYYLSRNVDGQFAFDDVSDDRERIFEKLVTPLYELEAERGEID